MAETKNWFDKKILGDGAWNYGAFALMAGTGVVLNFFIAGFFGIETLGVFNQIYAVYVVSAQLAVFGIHDSAQKYTAEFFSDPDQKNAIAQSAIILGTVFGFVSALIIYMSSIWIGEIADSVDVGKGVAFTAPGLFFFSLNKIMLGILNGERRMKAFAIAQSGRVLTILVFTAIVAITDGPGYMLGAAFTCAEIIIVIPVFVAVKPWSASPIRKIKDWMLRHLQFGYRAIANGFLAESYIRVDILMLGIFVSDHSVGLYSFAALFIEGLYQVPVVIRTVVNPVLVRLITSNAPVELIRFCRKTMASSFLIYALATGLVILIFPYLAPYFPEGLVSGSYPVLITVATGLAIYAAFIPVDFIVMQAGMPGRQSILMSINIIINIGLNSTLIPIYGIQGAAVATAIAFAFSALSLNIAVYRWLDLKGGFIFFRTRLD